MPCSASTTLLLLQETRTGLAIEREVVMEPVGGVGEVKQETVTLPLKKEE